MPEVLGPRSADRRDLSRERRETACDDLILMAGPPAGDLVREWQAAMQSVISAVGSAAGRSDAARQMLAPMERQVELLEQALEHQQKIQRDLVDRAFKPVDAMFDLLERSGSMMHEQAEALEQAAQAVERAAGLIRRQAELFETSTRTVRKPAGVLKSAAGSGRLSGRSSGASEDRPDA
jgi:methyl-accepting chemotaxis protein